MAPSAQSWAWAETLIPEVEQAADARAASESFGLHPIGQGGATALTFLSRAVNARAVVEIGTGAGVSGLALFRGMTEDGVLTSVDIEPEHQAAARTAFTERGIRNQRFRLIAGDALTVLPNLSDGAYDLVFVDADKVEYPAYVEQGVRLLRHGGVLVLDNALRQDRVAGDATDDETEAVREAIGMITEDEDLVPGLLPVGDGLLVAVKR
ncbi:MAG TPA: O-methyltransferase [Candidatus Avipropionibacterium avicola]|uniref:O-methyltransferase n=1 Tax=Candidatus Avipropionibacterium avicola TaxID=2840701 RepID=A0A9D1GWH9_9ACTN|nr:O-methyltransferase [Candidatus Avipropionibacterium avicola]